MPKKRATKRGRSRNATPSNSDVLDVAGIAALLRVSADTVYDLLGSGELPVARSGANGAHHARRRPALDGTLHQQRHGAAGNATRD